jgi:hypothetical protein
MTKSGTVLLNYLEEVREVNRKVLGIAVFLMAVAMLAVPVMAAPATKIEGVTITVVTPGPPVPYEGYPRVVSDGTISHSKGESPLGSTVTLFIPGVGTYEGDWSTEWIANANLKIGECVIPSKNTMTFAEGTFEGVNQRRITGNPMSPAAIEDQGVYKGVSGDFKGWTLKITNNEAYVIIP